MTSDQWVPPEVAVDYRQIVKGCENAFSLGRDSILARLRNPDEAMCTVFNEAWGFPGQNHTAQGIRALAAHLDEKEKADG